MRGGGALIDNEGQHGESVQHGVLWEERKFWGHCPPAPILNTSLRNSPQDLSQAFFDSDSVRTSARFAVIEKKYPSTTRKLSKYARMAPPNTYVSDTVLEEKF